MNPAARRQSTRSYSPNTGPSSRDRVPTHGPTASPLLTTYRCPNTPRARIKAAPPASPVPSITTSSGRSCHISYEEPPEHPDLMGTVERQ